MYYCRNKVFPLFGALCSACLANLPGASATNEPYNNKDRGLFSVSDVGYLGQCATPREGAAVRLQSIGLPLF